METYIELTIENIGQEQSYLLIAALDAIGYTGFLEESDCLKAYIPAAHFQQKVVEDLCKRENFSFSFKPIAPANWNEKWESSFSPVLVENFAAIRATFHPPVKDILYEVLINPKMSFGTGHHATTYLMIQHMQRLELKNKRVFDFGTGTGVLSILADKMGAAAILAIDNDEWSIENAKENLLLNNTKRVQLKTASYPPEKEEFDLILANINRSVLLKFFPALSNALLPAGLIAISGFLEEDKEILVQAAAAVSLSLSQEMNREGWVSILFKKEG